MAWVRIDDQAPRHDKMLKAGPAACWLWVCGIAHSQSQLTDGFIGDIALPMIGVTRGYKELAAKLVESGLWNRVDGGYVVHDYLDHNFSRAQVLAKRAADSNRKHGKDGARNPSGIQPESVVSRARVPSHPIPTVERERASTLDVSAPERVTDAFREHWKRTYGVESTLIINHLQFMDLERQLDMCGEQKILTAMAAFFATDDPYVRKARHPLALFLRDPTKYLATDAAVQSRPKGCTHMPACADAAAHTTRYLSEQKAS